MKKLFTKSVFLKLTGLLLGIIILIFVLRGVLLMPRHFNSQTTVRMSESNLQPWSARVRYLRRLAGFHADDFILSGAENTRFYDDYVEFESKGHLSYIDLPLVRRIDAEKIKGIMISMSFEPQLLDDEKFLLDIGRYFSRVGIALGDNFEHTLNAPLMPGKGFQEYYFFLGGFSDWSGSVEALRIIPALGPGQVRIREIAFLEEVPPEKLKLETAVIGDQEYYLAYLSDLQDSPRGIVPLENQLHLAFLEPVSVPAERMNKLSMDLQYNYEQPTSYLLYFNRNGDIVNHIPLQRNDDWLVPGEKELDGDFDYLGIYLPPDITDKLLLELELEYRELEPVAVELLPQHNNALIGDRDNFVIFLARQERIPHFVADSYMNIRYIDREYPRQPLENSRFLIQDVSHNHPRIKMVWEDKSQEQEWILPIEHPSPEIFLGKHPAFAGQFNHMEFILENFYGPLKIGDINFTEVAGEPLPFNDLAGEIFEKGLLFDNHGDCNSFSFRDGRYFIEARFDKGRIWSRQFPLVTDKMESLKVRYKMIGAPFKLRAFTENGIVEQTGPRVKTYNHPQELNISISNLEAPLDGFQLISPLQINWGKIENVSISGTDVHGERHHALLTVPQRTMPSEELSEYFWLEVAEGEFLLLDDMKLKTDINVSFQYTYSPNNRPYFYWFSPGKGREVHYLDGIRADGEEGEFMVPLAVTGAKSLPVWGLSLFWCPGTLEIISIEVNEHD